MELSESLGKKLVTKKHESLPAFGLLSIVWGAVIFAVILAFKDTVLFSARSIPLLAVRFLFEIIQMELTIRAITQADRSTYGFLRIITIPLLLVVDVVLGYNLTIQDIFAVVIIVCALVMLSMNHGIGKRGLWFVVGASVNAVITISLYKYSITHYNSLELDQFIMYIGLVTYFAFRLIHKGESPFSVLREGMFSAQSLSMACHIPLMSYAYGLLPASVVAASKRGLAVLGSVMSGSLYFHEKHLILKVLACVLIGTAFLLLLFK